MNCREDALWFRLIKGGDTTVKDLIRTAAVVVVALVLIIGAVSSVRWARRGGTAARLMGSALMLALGMGIIVKPPQQDVEQAREDKGKKGGESGDPPAA
ncbi:MAG: hypothetical protein ACREU2_11845 [Steroidobacteraceae bacterium]